MTSSNAAATDSGRSIVPERSPSPQPPKATTPPAIPSSIPPHPAADPIPTTATATTTTTATSTTATTTTATDTDANAPIPVASQQASTNYNEPHGDPDQDQDMPSPPTVSPLSTPAATHTNADDSLIDDDMPNLSNEPPPPTNGTAGISSTEDQGPQTAEADAANLGRLGQPGRSFAMELDHPQTPHQGRRVREQVQAVATTDPDPTVDYTSHRSASNLRHSQGTIDPNAYMMGLAQASTALFQHHVHAPAIVAPSEVSLQASYTQESDALTTNGDHTSTSASQKLESFARIEFADSVFQMTTYAVIIGRDQRAMDQARRNEKRELEYKRKAEANAELGLPPPAPPHFDRGKFSKSYVSEEGGMLGPESDGEENVRAARKRRMSIAKRSLSGDDDAQSDHVKSNRQYVSHTPGAAAVDLGTLQPSPSHIPFVGIHSPGPDIASRTRGISRQHLKIEFNEKKGVFEGVALHKNGFFCDDAHYGLDDPVTLRSGDRLQIKDVEFTFVINGVQHGKTGGEEYHDEEETSSKRMSIGGKEMSFDFEHSDHENFQDTSDELSEIENVPTPVNGSVSGGEVDDEVADKQADKEATAATAETQSDAEGDLIDDEDVVGTTEVQEVAPGEFATPDIPKRRGPGRPPKDGIMSKRERRLLKKQMQETSKKTLPQDPLGDKIKRPVGRPRKNPLPEDAEKPEKRKYNKRKPKEEGEEGSDAERRAREKKDKKVRPKSPPLDLRKEEFTEEQLQKPSKNYGVLIDEALTNGPLEGLTLKQIYKRIMSKYPWFYFSAETKGWESSVRHNLIGNEAFKKAEDTGLWSRVPGVELDAGKKRKASSPDRQLGPPHLHSHLAQPPYYQNGSYLPPNGLNFAHGLPSYTADTKPPETGYQPPPSQPAQSHSMPSSQSVAQPVLPAQVPAPAQLPLGYLSRQPNNTQQNTYSSPYARPPPPPNPPIKSENATTSNAQPPPAAPVQHAAVQPPSHHQQQPASSPPNPPMRSTLAPEIEKAISTFRTNMMNVLTKQTPHAAQIIDSAINRVRGLPVQNSVPGFESVENTLINAVQKMITEMQSKQRPKQPSASPAPAGPVPKKSTPAPSPAPTTSVDAEIQRRIKNFRDSMIAALRKKTDQAEAIVDSAINRAQGLPHTGKIQGWEEADNLMVKSVTQIITEARRAYGLSPQQNPPAPETSNRPVQYAQPAQQTSLQPSSASPAPAQPPTPKIGPVQSSNGVSASTPNVASTTTPKSTPLSVPRPGISIQRPAPMGLARPGISSISRPPVRPSSGTPTPTPPVTNTPTPAPIHNVSSPAPPSAGVVDQITGQRRLQQDDSSSTATGINRNNGSANVEQPQPEPVAKPAMPAPPPAPVPNMSSPAPPSAGVVDQITGQKRALDEGPGSASSEQPEAKKVAISPVV
ncbi:hypothetical protein F5B20DRAFT_536770 [Whalleya microplaca]|nr:hypothetical protein F5B20DRAFT_536770 [Whalleya microplaca]